MKVVVTGGSGQLGSLVVARLIAQRKIKRVVSIDLLPPRVASPKLEWHQADITDPRTGALLEGADVLVHTAFSLMGQAPDRMRSVNVEGSRRVFAAAIEHGARAIVYTSSIAAYGVTAGHPSPIVESTPRRRTGIFPYADHKFDVEQQLDELEARHPDLRVVRLRPSILFGTRITHGDARLLRRRVLPVVSDVPLPVVWDEDVAQAVLAAVLRDVRGAFNLSSDEHLSFAELAAAGQMRAWRVPQGLLEGTRKLAPQLRKLGLRPPDPGWVDAAQFELAISSERAKSELGWQPSCPTAADVARSFNERTPRRLDPRIAVFMRGVAAAARSPRAQREVPPEGRRMSLVLHLELTGQRGGDFTLRLHEGKLSIRRGVPRPLDAVISMSAETFLGVLSGTLNLGTARMTGKIRQRGEPMADFMLGAIVGGFRRTTEMPGGVGRASRLMSRWLARGG